MHRFRLSFIIALIFILSAIAFSPAKAATILLYQNNFNSPVGAPLAVTCPQVFNQTPINTLYGTPGFLFQQIGTAETVVINVPGYSDPTGRGGTYAIGMLRNINDDRLSLTLDAQGFDFLNIQMDIVTINGGGCGIPMVSVPNPAQFTVSVYNSPGGTFSIGAPTGFLQSATMTGNATTATSNSTYEWRTVTQTFDISSATDFITVYWDATGGTNYSIFDNLVITASDAPAVTGGVDIVQSGGTTDIAEGGATDDYTINLTSIPVSPVTITATPNAQCDLGAGAGVAVTRIFPADPTAINTQSVTVTAVDDGAVEGPHTCTIVHTSTSADTNYNGGAAVFNPNANVIANITDNDQNSLTVNVVCNGDNLDIDITDGDANFNITGTGPGLPINNVGLGLQSLPGPNSWTGVTVTELSVNTESINFGNFSCFPQTVQFASATGNSAEAAGIGDVLLVTTQDTLPTTTLITVPISVTGGTANLADYTLTGTITIPIGTPHNTTFSIASGITVNDDNTHEANDTLQLTLSAPTNASLGAQTTYTHTINNDEVAYVHAIPTTNTTAENVGTYNASFQLTIVGTAGAIPPLTTDLPIDFTVIPVETGTALEPEDFTTSTVAVYTFSAGSASGVFVNVPVSIVNDDIDEANESFDIRLASVTNGTLPPDGDPTYDNSQTVTITDDDTAGYTVDSSAVVAISEPNTATSFTIRLNSQPEGANTVILDFGSTDLTECTVSPASFTFNNGNWNVAQTITITAVDEFLVDGAQSCSATITQNGSSTAPEYGSVANPANVTVTVNDNDAPATITITGGDAQSAVVTTAFTNPLVVEVRNASGELVEGATVTFTAPGAGASAVIVGSPATTNASGVASVTATANSTTGTYNVTVTSGAAPSVNFSLTNIAGVATSISFSQQPTDAVAGVIIAPAVTAAVLDGFGNPVSGTNVTLNLSTGTGVLSGTLTQATNASGVATFADLSIDLIGSKNITATAGALSVISSGFNITSATATNITFSQQPTDAVAGVIITPAVTATITDTFGNPIVGQNVVLTLTTGTGTLSGTLTQATNGSGVATFADLSIDLIGSKNITATAGALNVVSNAFTITSAGATNITFSQQPTDAVAGVIIAPALAVTITDTFGNPIVGQNVTLNLSTGTGTLSGTLTQATNAGGVATFADLSIDLVGSKNITATAGALSVISSPFNITVASATNITFSQQPTDAVAGVIIAPAVTVTITDTFGNPIVGQNVTLALTTGTGALSGTLTQATNAGGLATFADLSIDLVGSKNITATAGALSVVSTPFNITVASATNITFSQQPTDAVAGATIAPAVAVTITDTFGNPIVGQNVTLNLSTGTGILSGTLTQVTNGSGIATFNDLSIDLVGSKNITATAGALSVVSSAFNITSAVASSITFSQQPTDAIAGATIAPAVTVTILDGFGNPIVGQNVTLALTTGTGVLGGTLTQATNGSGIATFADLNINLVGSKNITATAGALNVVSSAFNITVASATNITFSQQPTDAVAGATIAPAVAVTITDAFGNPIVGQNVTLNLSTGSGALSGTLTQATNGSGIATFNDLSIDLVGSKNITATAGALSVVSSPFIITSGAPGSISFSQQPTDAVAGVIIAPAVTVTVLDGLGNPISGQNVTLTLSTGTGVLSGTLTQATNGSGIATFADLSINLIGSKNITATSGALNVVSNAFTITSAGATSISFSQQPTDAIAGATIVPAVTVTILDGFGNPVSGTNVTLNLSTGTGVLSGTLTQATNGSGVATFADLSINLIGSKNITATAGALSVVSSAFNITSAAASSITFSQQPTDAVAGATIAPAVTVTVLDGLGNPISGQNVTLNLSTGTGVLSGTLTQATNGSGVATFADLSINLIGSKNITATSGALSVVSSAFTITSAGATSITFSQQPTDAIAGATITPAVTVTILDGLGNPVSGTNVTLNLSTGTGVLSGTLTQATNGSGVATFADLSINLIGSKNITATAGALNVVSSGFNITSAAASSITFSQQPTDATAGATIAPAVTVTVLDGLGNPISGQNVILSLSTGTGVLSGTLTQATNASGVATFADLSINLIGSKNITATSGALNVVSSAFNITSGGATTITFVQQPTNAIAGATITPVVTVLLTDVLSNPIVGQNVTLTLSTGTGTLSGTLTQATNGSGVATFADLSINLIGSKNITATSGALNVVSSAFTITSATATTITFSQQPTDTVAGATIIPAVAVTINDTFGNPISGTAVTLNLSTGTGVLSGTLTQNTNGSGIATFADLSIDLIGSKNITATAGALNVVSSAFLITSGAPGSITFSQQPTDAVAGVTIAPAMTVTVLDGLGNPISGQNVIVNLSTGTGVLSGTLTVVTNGSGVATFGDLSINLIGSKNITATAGIATVVSNAFTITSASSANITFVQQPTDAIAGATIAPAVTVVVTDGFGNPIVGTNVALTLSTGTGVLSGTLTQATNASGVATFADLNINLIGIKNITATAGALNVVSSAFTITSATATNIDFVQQPTDTIAGVNIAPAVTVLVTDLLGNPVSGQNVVINLSTGTGVLGGTLTQATNGSGVATFADLNINLIGSKNLTATLGTLTVVSNPFNITSNSAFNITFGQQPTTAVAGVAIAPAITVTITDVFGNPISGQNVVVNLSTGTGVLSGTLTQATNGSGVATFADLSINLIGSKNITATLGALNVVSNAFTITSATASSISFSQQPTDAPAGVTIAPAVTVTILDGFGNSISGLNVTLNLSTGTGVLSGTLTQATNAGGVATFNDLSINLTGSKNITATAGALNVVSSAFTITSAGATSISFSQQPTDSVAGATIAPAVTVNLLDGFGNPVGGQNITLSLSTGTGVLSGTLTQATNASGIATFADLSIDLIGSKNITATSGALNVVSSAFTITSATATTITFSQQPTDTVAGATITPAVTVTITDTFGNPISGTAVTVNLSTGTGVLSGTLTQNTNVGGVATFNDFSINLIGSKNITATAGALTVVSNPFNITSAVASSISFSQQPTDAVAGVTIVPAVTVTLLDGFGNPISGQNVTLNLSTGTGALSGTLTQATNAGGVATFADLSINLVGSKNITATSGALSVVSNPFNITVAAPALISFGQQPTDTVAGATITPAVTVTITDAFGNPIIGTNATVSLSTGTGTLGGTLTIVTNGSGVATFGDLNINLVGSKNLTVTSGALTVVSNPFNITSAGATSISFSQQPTDAVAGATIAPAVTVTVLDGFGNPIVGQNVTLNLSAGTGVLSGTLTQATNAGGVATFADLSINLIGSKNITATSGALSVVSNSFNITSAVASSITFSQQPTDSVAGATIAPAVTMTILDAFGNPVSGQNVTLNLSTGTGVLSGTLTQATNAGGVATFADLSINLIGSKNITATSGALTVVSNAFTILSSAPTSIIFVQQPTDAVAGATIAPAVTVLVTDSLSNPVSGATVTLTLTTGTGIVSGTLTQATDGAGVATFADLSIDLIGSKNITATTGGLSVVSNAFIITAPTGSGTGLVIVSGNPQQTATSTAFALPLVVRVTDTFGNPVAGETVTFTANVGGGGQSASLSAPAVTDINGETSVIATANGTVGAYTVDATLGAQIATFTLDNLDPNALTVGVACVDANLVVTIASGSGNFNITTSYGVGMPLMNVPLGAYTFPGPETWLDITVTELGGDLEVLLVGNVSCDALSPTTNNSAPAPLDPNAIGCVLTSEVVAPGAPDNTYCRVLMRDGEVITYPGAVPQTLIDLDVIFAVDIYRLDGGQWITTFPDYQQICLSGVGRLFYLDARLSPRNITEMTTESVNDMTCAWLPATGTLVLTNR